MSFGFGYKSRRELVGVHSDLVIVVATALTTCPVDFAVFDGMRTPAEQQENIRKGVSWTMNSRHLTGHAVDLVPIVDGRLSWDDPEDPERQARIDRAFDEIKGAMADAAARHNVPIQWGFAMWKKDKPHYQLPKQEYPA